MLNHVWLFATPWTVWPTRLLCPCNSPGKITRVGNHSLLQGIFLTQGSNLGLLHCQQILYHLNHEGSSLMYIDLMINDIEKWYVFFWKTSIEGHCPFLEGYLFFLFLSCLNLLILDANLFLDAWFTVNFSHCIGCLITLLILPFTVQIFLVWWIPTCLFLFFLPIHLTLYTSIINQYQEIFFLHFLLGS